VASTALAALGVFTPEQVGTKRNSKGYGEPQKRGNNLAQSILASMMLPFLAYNPAMNGVTIYVDWQYFLGILGALIGMAYYGNGRFTKIETTVEWLKEILLEIKKQLDNDGTQQKSNLAPSVTSRRYRRTRQN
jgi:hypothetical protein